MVHSGDMLEEALPEKGTAKNMMQRFKQLEAESKWVPAHIGEYCVLQSRAGNVGLDSMRVRGEGYSGASMPRASGYPLTLGSIVYCSRGLAMWVPILWEWSEIF